MGMFQRATRHKTRLRMAIDGPAGSGKTFTALRFAFALSTKVAVINSESGAIEKYLGLAPDGVPFQFDILTLNDFAPARYTEAIMAAGREGYDVILIDSLSHAWAGIGGALEIKDKKSAGNNSFTAWKDVTPMHNAMIEAILRSPAHVIATMRSKVDYVLEEVNGKKVPKKVGMAPIQRNGMEYEFDVYCSMDGDHFLTVSKSRCPEIDNQVVIKPGSGFIEPLKRWLEDGSDIPPEAFAVTEADLQKFIARSQTAELAQASQQRPKSVEEILAEQEAAMKPQPPAPQPPLDTPIAKEVVEQIKAYAIEIAGLEPEFMVKFRQVCEAKPIGSLTTMEGIELTNKLAKQLLHIKNLRASKEYAESNPLPS